MSITKISSTITYLNGNDAEYVNDVDSDLRNIVASINAGNLIVGDIDGVPSVTGVKQINFTNGSVTDNGDGTVNVATGAGGGGDVSGPASGTDNAVVRMDGASGKVIQNSTVIVDDSGNVTGLGTLNTHTLPSGTDTLVGRISVDTLENKTLTAAKIANGGFLADANGNELVIMTTTASAVNEITYANAATGNNPTLTASGETNVGLTITGKGTKGVRTGNAFMEKEVTLTDGATPALDASLGNVFVLTAAGDRTIAVPTNPPASGYNQKMVIKHIASGGARTLSLNTGAGGFKFGTDVTALTATTSGKTDIIGCLYDHTLTAWLVVAYVKGY